MSSSTQYQHHHQCAICLEDKTTFVKLPCCGRGGDVDATSSVQICNECILLLLTPTSSSFNTRLGRCPRCRAWLVLKEEGELQTVDAAGPCRICRQLKEHLVLEQAVCDACWLGARHPLIYECSVCHCYHRIPHPMYRYQPRPDAFGTVTWACQRCGDYTNWRILPQQLHLIPVGDAPEEWGEDYHDIIQQARARVQEEAARREAENGAYGGSCGIL